MKTKRSDNHPRRGSGFEDRVKKLIKKIPSGRVATYGQIAALAGNPRGARQVVRVLHSSSEKLNLPWHRVINSKGTISLGRGRGYELQKAMLSSEGVQFDTVDRISLDCHQWRPKKL